MFLIKTSVAFACNTNTYKLRWHFLDGGVLLIHFLLNVSAWYCSSPSYSVATFHVFTSYWICTNVLLKKRRRMKKKQCNFSVLCLSSCLSFRSFPFLLKCIQIFLLTIFSSFFSVLCSLLILSFALFVRYLCRLPEKLTKKTKN